MYSNFVLHSTTPPPPPLQDNHIDADPEHDYHPVSDGVGGNDGIYRSKKYNSGGGTKFGFDQDFRVKTMEGTKSMTDDEAKE